MKFFKLITTILVVVMLLAFLPQPCLAIDTGKIEGKVIDAHTQRPLVGANVVIEGTTLGAASGTDGSYVITAVPAGEYNLIVSMMGYRKITKKVEVFADEITTVNFELKVTVLKGDMIVVTATRTEHFLKDVPVVSADVITKREIEAANVETVTDALKLVPGLYQHQIAEAVSGFKSQGLPVDYTLILIDGQRVYHCPGRMPDLNIYPAEMIDRIEVIKGAAATLYGSEALGGVINIITKSAPHKPTFSASTAFGDYKTQIHKVSHGNKVGKFGYRVHYNHRESDGVEPELDRFRNDDFWGTLEYKFTPTLKLTLKPGYYRHRSVWKGKYGKEEKTLVNCLWEWKPDELSNLIVMASLQEKLSDGDWWFSGHEVGLTYHRLVKGVHLVTGGYQFHRDKFDMFRREQYTHSFYVQDEIAFRPLTLVLGGRVDDHNWWGTHYNPSASLLYRATDDLRLKASAGKAFKSPKACFFVPERTMRPFGWLDPNPDLGPEESISYQIGIEYRISENILSKISLFRNDIEDMLKTRPTGEMYGPPGKKRPVFIPENIARVHTQGLELGLLQQLTDNLSGQLGYSFLDTEDEETGEELTYEPKHIAMLVFNWKVPDYGLGINLRGEYIGKRYYEVKVKKTVTRHELGDYFLAHIKVSKDFLKYSQVFLAVDNIFDKSYYEYEGREMPGRKFFGGLRVKL